MDPRLNSMHLPAKRREEFRAARSGVLNACGRETFDRQRQLSAFDAQHTAIISKDHRFPPGVNFVLLDHDCAYPLKVGINTVGRLPDNDVVVKDPYVSRRHVALVVHLKNKCELHDIASKNGTWINGKPVNGHSRLQSGDTIQLSDHVLVFLCKKEIPSDSGADQTMAE